MNGGVPGRCWAPPSSSACGSHGPVRWAISYGHTKRPTIPPAAPTPQTAVKAVEWYWWLEVVAGPHSRPSRTCVGVSRLPTLRAAVGGVAGVQINIRGNLDLLQIPPQGVRQLRGRLQFGAGDRVSRGPGAADQESDWRLDLRSVCQPRTAASEGAGMSTCRQRSRYAYPCAYAFQPDSS